MKNKFKFMGAAAAVVAVSAPIITLASCNKAPDINITEAEKTKEVTAGEKSVTYTFKLNSNVQEGEILNIDLENIVSTQEGYTIEKTNLEYTVGSNEVKLTVTIKKEGENDTILQEGTKFTFDVTVTRMDSAQKVLATAKFTGLNLTYASVPTKEALSITEATKHSYTNPGALEHVFAFDINSSVSIDEDCQFECDVTNKDTSTEGYSASYVKTEYNKSLNKVFITFQLNKKGTTTSSEKAEFDFNLSCTKDGKELWRQNFTDFRLTYLYHQMYIFVEKQQELWPRTYAGDPNFHIYVARNENLHWTDPSVQPGIAFSNNKLSVNTEIGVKEGYSETYGYYYFDVPVKITSTETVDEEISFIATLSGHDEAGTAYTEDFSLKIKNIVKKVVDDSTTKQPTLILKTTNDFAFTLTDTTSDITAELECTTPTTQVLPTLVGLTKDGTSLKAKVNILPYVSKGSVEFNLNFTGKVNGQVAWEQQVKGFKIEYVDPIEVAQTIETELATSTGLMQYTLMDGAAFAATTPISWEIEYKTEDVDSINIVKDEDTSKFLVTITPATGKHLNKDTFVRFALTINGTYGTSATEWTKTLSCGITYNGYVELSGETPAQHKTLPGKTSTDYLFTTYNKYTLKPTLIEQSVPAGYKLDYSYKQDIEKDNFTLTTTISKIDGGIVEDGITAKFKVAFTAYDDEGKAVWTKTYTESSLIVEFSMEYVSSITPTNREIRTNPSAHNAFMELNDLTGSLQEGQYYELAITSQTHTSDIDVTLAKSKILYPSGSKFDAEFNMVKTSGELHDKEFTHFELEVKKCASDGTVITKSIIKECKITYIGSQVAWDSESWYVSELEDGSTSQTKPGYINFNLASPLASGQELYAKVTPKTTGTSGVTLHSTFETLTKVTDISGKVATIPMYLQTTNGAFTIGDYQNYEVEFTLKNDTGVLWTMTVSDLYLGMLAHFTCGNTQKTITSTRAEFNFQLSAKIPASYIGTEALQLYATARSITTDVPWLSINIQEHLQYYTDTSYSMFVSFAGEATQGDKVAFEPVLPITLKIGTTKHYTVIAFPSIFSVTQG